MSKVAIKGADTGTGVFTLESPATNTNRTLVLPDEAGTVLTTAGVPASAMPAGSVIQVVQGTYSTAIYTASSSFINTGLEATITPTATSSKILIISREQLNGDVDNDGVGDATGQYRLYRNGSAIIESISSVWARGGLQRINDGGFKYLDSPNSTSALTYATYVRMAAGSRGIGVNGDGLSTMILLEIAG